MRIHPPNYSPSTWDTNQMNDPSYKACTGSTYDPRPGFIGYVGGRQSWPAPNGLRPLGEGASPLPVPVR